MGAAESFNGQLELLQPAQIRAQWPEIRHGLECIIAKGGESWLPEDVWLALVAGQYYLYQGDGGFIVVNTSEDCCRKVLFIWCAYSKSGDAVLQYSPALKDMARLAGCVAIQFESKRAGWAKHATAVFTTYEIEVEK